MSGAVVSGQLGGTGSGSAVEDKTAPRPVAAAVFDRRARYVAREPGGAFEVVWNGRRIGYYATLAVAERVYNGRARLDADRPRPPDAGG